MPKQLFPMFLFAALVSGASAQQLALPQSAWQDEASLAEAMPSLAQRAIAVYEEPDRGRYLNLLFRLQMVAGQYPEAVATLQELIELRRAARPGSALPLLPFVMLAKAKAKQAATEMPLEEAFKQEFHEVFDPLDGKAAIEAFYWFGGDLQRMGEDLRAAVENQRGKDSIALADALDLVRKYQFHQAFQLMMPLSDTLIAEDDARRYLADRNLLIETTGGARIAAMVVRPRSAVGPLPTLLLFTIYADDEQSFAEARRAAAHGYAGVVAYSRGKGRSPDRPVPYEHEAEDVREVIDWIIHQPWSDQRVGMYGGSYAGFSQWAAVKNPHPALKTIVPYAAAIPGLGLPMENNVFLNANYGWAFYVTNNKYLDGTAYSDPGRWDSMENNWYASGKPYRQIDAVDGTPNSWLQRWLQHPNYDQYWQDMVPYQDDYARITIPVLTITGYYDDGQISALHYFKEHYKYNQAADHYLLIGPYDHFGAQAPRKAPVLRGYAIDPAAQIDTPEITLQWMDYVLRGGKKPALLKDKINYQVMGANEWKHAPSLEKMSTETLTLYLTDKKLDDHYRLSKEKPSEAGSLHQEVDFADRTTTNNNDYYPWPIVGKEPDLSSGFSFISQPFDEPVEISGTLTGEIKAVINKQDMDIGIVFYELMPGGELFHLSYFLGRASYAKDMSARNLLTPGAVESIPFERTRMVSRRLSQGSRLLVTLNVNKNPSAQLNYGTGKDVSDESLEDAKEPLKIQWLNDSFVRIPIWKE